MGLFSEVWFWFLVIAIVLFVIALIIFAFRGSNLPGWFWFILILSAAFVIGAVIIYLVSATRRKPKVEVVLQAALPPPSNVPCMTNTPCASIAPVPHVTAPCAPPSTAPYYFRPSEIDNFLALLG